MYPESCPDVPREGSTVKNGVSLSTGAGKTLVFVPLLKRSYHERLTTPATRFYPSSTPRTNSCHGFSGSLFFRVEYLPLCYAHPRPCLYFRGVGPPACTATVKVDCGALLGLIYDTPVQYPRSTPLFKSIPNDRPKRRNARPSPRLERLVCFLQHALWKRVHTRIHCATKRRRKT
ncbi:hypothetical protein BDM02DRAFT_924743 [Thelephora ganbajun]|uniref:Uncharacterized protein n=2 Tax=Thelephora ganbajun TaxID=370292 RepID=A0ACB6YYR9_THEGA|nr:hypothetical protein BDM02DRAFT_2255624 [Thelephora ganbajun]KAF9644563.1 hypothetical protein BDM02DRAFT_924743 [Thelephora ganbajun]